jgi:hypothetical protein
MVIAISGSVFAQSVDQILDADKRRMDLARQSQERINTVVEKTRSMEDSFRAVNKEIDGLKVYNRLMRAQVEGQKAVLEDIDLSMDQVDVLNRQIFPLMVRMIDGLEQTVNLDIPFLLDERQKRITRLKDIMSQSNVTVSEKFRKVMEAYQIENDYGSSSEHYKQSIEFEGGLRSFNMLRIGRIGLYFQSDDTKITGRWDNKERDWVRDDSARNEIRKGLRIARGLVAPELINIPVPAAEAS